MSQKWQVFQGNRALGIMDAQQIRRALRSGELDPFDLVAKEGSQEKTELIEVDEIFQEELADDATHVPTESFQQAPLPSAQWQTPSPPSSEKTQIVNSTEPTQSKEPSFSKQEAEEATSNNLIIPDEPKQAARPTKPKRQSTQMPQRLNQASYSLKRKDKKFILIDEKNRNLGPLTALEVQSLYHKGLVPKNVRVQRMGTDKKVPIRQFISAYSGKRMKALADQSAIRRAGAQPSVKVLNELHHLMNSKKLADKQTSKIPNLLLAVVGIGLGVILFFSIEQFKSQNTSGVQKINAPQLLEAQQPQTAPKVAPRPRRVATKEVSQIKPPIKEVPKPVRSRSNPPPTIRKSTPKPVVASKPSPAPQVKPVTSPIKTASAKAGSVISVGPISFNEKDLEDCNLKCEINFADATGAKLKAVFFKGAYYEKLKKVSDKPVTLVGSSKLEGSELIIFIQDVK